MEFLNVYFSYIKMFFKARMEYKFSFLGGIFSNLYCYLITYMSFWVIVNNFGSINGWTFDEISILYGINLLTYCIAGMLFWGVFGLEKEITSGDLDSLLLRPMGVIRQLICKRFADTFIGQVVIAVIFLSNAFYNISPLMTPIKYLYLVAIIITGVFIHGGAMIFFGSLSFWMNRSLSLADLLYYDLRLFTQYPIVIFPMAIRILLTFILPWAFINYYPAVLILGKEEINNPLLMGALSPVAGVLFFVISIIVFRFGLGRYSGSGS